MINILVVAGVIPPRKTVLVDALRQFRERGAKVSLACYFNPATLALEEGLAESRSLAEANAGIPKRVRRAAQRAGLPRRIWLRASRDPWLRQRAREADVLIAIDQAAIHTVWQLAARNRAADAVYGLAPAIEAVDARTRDPQAGAQRPGRWSAPSPLVLARGATRWSADAARASAGKTLGRTVLSTAPGRWFWRTVVSAPRLPDDIRIKLAVQVRAGMVASGNGAAAKQAMTAASARLSSEATRARLRSAAIARDLAAADAAYGRGQSGSAAGGLLRATDLLFDRLLHFDRMTSPLADDPAGFLASLHRSKVAKAVGAPRGRSAPARTQPLGRPRRLLMIAQANESFLVPIRERYLAHPDTEVRYLNVATDPELGPLTFERRRLVEHILAGKSEYGSAVQRLLGPHLEWADTVFVDWCVMSAAMVSLLDPGDTRVVMRLHSFEVFKLWPHLIDFSRVDDLVFVSEHLRDLTVASVPRLASADAPRTRVIANAMDLRRYPRAKPAQARFNLGVVGIKAVAKDPCWAVAVLRILRQHDSRYRLLLLGADLKPEESAAARQYRQRFDADIAELEQAGAVRRLGQVSDVPAHLTDVGVVVSSSVRESFHCGLVEGAASGAVPIVRNWPFFAGKRHGAHTLFPADWVVDTPQQAAERILQLTATEQAWREAGQEASAYSLAAWDWTVTQTHFDRLLLDPAPAPANDLAGAGTA